MADDAVAGAGPGEQYVTLGGIAGISIYLVLLTFLLLFLLMWLWPSCEVSINAARSTTAFTVTSITPSSGKISGGDAVTITGTGFTEGATVSFDDAAATDVQVVDSTALTARSPAHKAGRVDIVVRNPDARSQSLAGGFIFVDPLVQLPKPSISSVTPPSGPLTGGQFVTISGTGFSNITTVSFGGLRATNVQVSSDTALTATTPAHPEEKVDVVVGDGSTATLSGSYTYTCWGAMPYRLFSMVILAGALGGTLHGLRSLFWYVGNRNLRWSWLLMYFLLPVSGAAMAAIFFLVAYAGLYTVQGTGSFILVGLAAVVGMFSPQAAQKLKEIAEGLLTTVPPGEDHVEPQPAGGVSQPAPLVVTRIAPSSGSAGTQVTITGTGFSTRTTVRFGDVPAENVQVVNNTTMTATTPAHDAGAVDVVVSDGSTSATLRGGYTYVSAG